MILRLSLYCLRDIRLGNSSLYACNFANSNDSLSIPTASDVIFNATISRSENLGTTPLLGTLPDSLTKFPATCLHMFSNFANIAYRLCIRYLSIKSLITFNLLNINNMHNFLYIFFYQSNSANGLYIIVHTLLYRQTANIHPSLSDNTLPSIRPYSSESFLQDLLTHISKNHNDYYLLL